MSLNPLSWFGQNGRYITGRHRYDDLGPSAALAELLGQVEAKLRWSPVNSGTEGDKKANASLIRDNNAKLAGLYGLESLAGSPVTPHPKEDNAFVIILNPTSPKPLDSAHIVFRSKKGFFGGQKHRLDFMVDHPTTEQIVAALWHVRLMGHGFTSLEGSELLKLQIWAHAKKMGIPVASSCDPKFPLSAFQQRIVEDIDRYHEKKAEQHAAKTNPGVRPAEDPTRGPGFPGVQVVPAPLPA